MNKEGRVQKFEELYKGLLDQVLKNVEIIRTSAKSSDRGSKEEYYNVIGIAGKRGFGKSTLLYQACEKLKEGPDLVLKPISPYDFKESESLYALILAKLSIELDNWRESVSKKEGFDDRFEEIDAELNELQLNIARSSWQFMQNLIHSGLRGDDFAFQFKEAQRRKIIDLKYFPEFLKRLLHFYNQMHPGKNKLDLERPPLLIVPLDDCDTSPEIVPQFIDELGRICESPHVVMIISYSPDALFRAVSYKILDPVKDVLEDMINAKLVKVKDFQQEVNDLIYKIIPSSHRVELPGWGKLSDRLEYYHITKSDLPLINLMENLKFKDGYPVNNLRDYFDLSSYIYDESSKYHIPSPYAEILPTSGRSLFNLYESLQIFIKNREPSKYLEPEELAVLLQIFCKSAVEEFPAEVQREFNATVKWNNRKEFSIDFEDLKFGDSSSQGMSIFRKYTNQLDIPSLDDITNIDLTDFYQNFSKESLQEEFEYISGYIYRHDNFFMWKELKKGDEKIRSEVPYERLLKFLMEFNIKEFSVFERKYGSFQTPGLIGWDKTHALYVDGDWTIDFPFFIVPDYSHYLPFFIYSYVWNGYVEQIRESEIESELYTNNSILHDLMGLLHLDLILSLQMTEKIKPQRIPGNVKTVEDISETVSKLQNDIIDKLSSLLHDKKSHRLIAINKEDFPQQFGHCCVHLASTLVLSSDLVEWIRENILKKFSAQLYDTEIKNVNFGKYLSHPSSYARYKLSGIMFADLARSVYTIDPEQFNKIIQEKYKKFMVKTRLYEPGTIQILEILLERQLLTRSDIDLLSERGMIPPIEAKLKLVPNAREIINELHRLFPPIKPDEKKGTEDDPVYL